MGGDLSDHFRRRRGGGGGDLYPEPEGNARRGGEKAGACGSRISGKTAGAVEISSLPEGDGLVFRYTVKRYLKAKMYKRNF